MTDLDHLESLAMGATPGPWIQLDGMPYLHATSDPNVKPWQAPCIGRFDYSEQDMRYIAACSPEVILRLCAIARAARPVAFSNGFDAALPDKLAALRAALGKER
jgi:hypothetical protein